MTPETKRKVERAVMLTAVRGVALTHGNAKLALDLLCLEDPEEAGNDPECLMVALARVASILRKCAREYAGCTEGRDGVKPEILAMEAETLEDIVSAARTIVRELHALAKVAK